MKINYDVVVVGAGLVGCIAAIKAANQGGRVAIIEAKKNIPNRPFVEYLQERDFCNLKLEKSEEVFVAKGIVNVAGSKVAFETDYPGDFKVYFTKGHVIVNKLRELITENKGIEIFYNSEVTELVKTGNEFIGVKIRSGEMFNSKIIILCSGNHKLDNFSLNNDNIWPEKINKFTGKTKVAIQIPYKNQFMKDTLKGKVWWFFTRNTFDYYSLYPFSNHAVFECCFADSSIDDSIEKIEEMLTGNKIVKELIEDPDLSELKHQAQEFTSFGIRLPTYFPGLIIAGDAMNLTSPFFIHSIYPSLISGICAGESATKILKDTSGNNEIYANYEMKLIEELIEIKNDFQIIKDSVDQFNAFSNGTNALLENFVRYYPEICI